ncbi:hypothetical protein, partial [Bordetella pseudohinzii]|uniref:hypothetical protein n=1 Tax=Bordetella pseudohinzii TaxID=1331258 RepID=UPI001F1EEB29
KLSAHGSNRFFVVARDFFCSFAQGRSKAARCPGKNAQALRKTAAGKPLGASVAKPKLRVLPGTCA